MKRYFITGTDTDCGKTFVTKWLLKKTKQSIALKPVASGGDRSDAKNLLLGNGLTLDDINPWHFSMPVSPHLAARNENKSIDIKQLADFCLEFDIDNCETLFIEGAGGLMVPLNDKETWIDFLKLTKIPVIVVVGMRLGCINHALLTFNMLKSQGLECAGWIANCLDPNMILLEDNIKTIQDFFDSPLIDRVPFSI